MKIEKRGNSYRVRKMVEGHQISLTFDHRPTQLEVLEAIQKYLKEEKLSSAKGTFEDCAREYIQVKSNVLSPTTIRSYGCMLNAMDESFKSLQIREITGYDIQRFINAYSLTHKPKSTRNVHGFISAVLGLFRPELTISTTLPQKRKIEPYIPTEDEVERILSAVRNTRYYAPYCLACLGLRQSEIMALTTADIDADDILTINKAKVRANGEYALKTPKTESSIRRVQLPHELAELIRQQGYVYEGHPSNLNDYLSSVQKRLGIEHFAFHKFRHFACSMYHDMGMSDETVKKMFGWKQTSQVMQQVYRHAMKDSVAMAQAKAAAKVGNMMGNSGQNPGQNLDKS